MKLQIKSALVNKELHWTILFQFSTLVGGVLLMKLLAVTLSAAEYGFYAIITSIVAFVLTLPFTALLQGVSRYVSIYQKKGQYELFLNTVLVLILCIVTIYVFISLIFYKLYPLGLDWGDLFFIVIVLTVSEVFKVLFKTINNANRQRKNIAISVFVEFFLKLILIFYVYVFFTANITYVLYALILGNLFAVIVLYIQNVEYISILDYSIKKSRVIIYRIWLFSYPLLIWAVFGWLRDMSNRWYLDYFLGKEEVALFSMMGSLALVAPVALQGVIGSYFVPIIYQKENSRKGAANKLLNVLLPVLTLVFSLGFVVICFFKDFIVSLLTDDKYLSVAWMLPWMFLAYSLYVISMISTYELFSQNQTKKLIVSSVLPGVIAFVGGYLFINNYGINGALYNYMLTYISYALLTFYVLIKFRKNNDNS